MSSPRRIYWDSSCFICFLNDSERIRGNICDDVLKHASNGELEIWISMWVMVEVIRPKRPGNSPLPAWALKAIKATPDCEAPLKELWLRFQRKNPTPKLTAKQIALIQGMFDWPFIKKVQVDELVAKKAVELSRDYNLGSGDAVHAARAIIWKCETIQRWDKDFSRVAHLIPSEEPQRLSGQNMLLALNSYGPNPEEFTDKEEPKNGITQETIPTASNLPGSGEQLTQSEAAPEAPKETTGSEGEKV